ncbi:MAG: DUF1800 family protein [Verrucomicrobia subdivision 3 bacterium]|nr:DUF1800 family protein [Limisphaerales bacterium]
MGLRNVFVAAGLSVCTAVLAADPPPPLLNLTVTNGVKSIGWGPLVPALETLNVQSSVDFPNFSNNTAGTLIKSPAGYNWAVSNSLAREFFRVQQSFLSSNALLSYNVLNRIAYGPSPDDLERILTGPNPIGPQAYIDEQLAPETVPPTLDSYIAVVTNGVSLPPATNWTTVTVTGIVTSSTLYMYMVGAGNLYLDDVQLRVLSTVITTNQVLTTNMGVVTTNYTMTTNTVVGPNRLVNGNFESPLSSGWTVSSILSGSSITTAVACEGASSLRMVSSGVGNTQGSSIWQTVTPALPINARCVLSFSYLPNSYTDLLNIRLSSSGVIASGAEPAPPPPWIYATATGTATTTPNLYIYLSGAGEGYIDDIRLYRNSDITQSNLVRNGDFEQPFSVGWQATADFANSVVDNTVSHSGGGSLRIVATAAGGGANDSVYQVVSGLTSGQTYTLSYWYRPASRGRTLTVRLSGSQLVSTPDGGAAGLKRRLDDANWSVSLDELRTWLCHNAVGSQRQLLEILTQFFENHFVTYHSKTVDYLDRYYNDFNLMNRIAADLEYREVSRWRAALLNPNCTFYDLLKIHVESPAEIIYLDTVSSRGDTNRIANENYARELFELFAMGVDNGYDQNDIVAMSRAWTGWTVDLVRKENINNPFADRRPEVQQYGFAPGAGSGAVSNRIGVWTFVYNPNWHGTNRAPILSAWDPTSPATNPVAIGPKTIPARFGPPWAGRPYWLQIPRRTGTNSIQDGYDVIRHLADLPFTAEYISVKLCRLFIHDEFPNPTATVGLPEYDYYNYTNPNRTPEAELIRRCIVAWDTPGPDGRKGNIRAVLRTIFDSELFRSHAGSRQKVKTPLEFVISSVRALRATTVNPPTAFTDGNFNSQLGRMGSMSLFNRADPDGYPEAGPPWISAGTLAERLRFIQTLLTATGSRTNLNGTANNDAGNNTVNPVALLKAKLPAGSWNNAGAVADYFLGLLYAGEGRANLDLYRDSAINFLNTGDNGATSLFSSLGNTTTAYDTRVRGMVAMLMTLQRFQEQ